MFEALISKKEERKERERMKEKGGRKERRAWLVSPSRFLSCHMTSPLLHMLLCVATHHIVVS